MGSDIQTRVRVIYCSHLVSIKFCTVTVFVCFFACGFVFLCFFSLAVLGFFVCFSGFCFCVYFFAVLGFVWFFVCDLGFFRKGRKVRVQFKMFLKNSDFRSKRRCFGGKFNF